MIENEIIQTSDGNMDTFLVRPNGDNKFPLVVFLMDAPGKREELHDMARRIASSGYYVLLPICTIDLNLVCDRFHRRKQKDYVFLYVFFNLQNDNK